MKLDGRMEARVAIALPIYLLDAKRAAQPPELALTENVSASGIRVVTKWRREPGEQERVTLLSGEDALAAQVVYCQQAPNSGYCVGLRLKQPCAEWWQVKAKPLRIGVAARWAAMWRQTFWLKSGSGAK